MATLVTGASGFVASNIVRMLIEQGEQVVAFDIVPPSDLLQDYINQQLRPLLHDPFCPLADG